ncbi:MAG: esterase/lipase family protein [Bradymonadaceae bacterium]
MPIRHIGDIASELGGLYLYAASSVAGSVIRARHHRDGHRRPVVIVPGFLGRSFNYTRLQTSLSRRGHPAFVADLGFNVGCIKEKSYLLERFIDDHELDDFFVIGHSMGGLISLGMSNEARERVRHFLTLGTAYHGAVLSYLFPLLPAARQLQPRSEVLREVIENARGHENLTNIVARWDEIAIPLKACRLGNCRELEGVAGHVQLIRSPLALKMIAGILEEFED